jgi:glycosyltransferase involved in cell wall biosynthesis
MHDEPEVSVLLPYRNAESTLDEALSSVLEQQGVAIELLAVDDGSRDDSAALVARHAARDVRVRMLHTTGVGIAGALTHALQAARAPLLARMDADDVSLPGRLQAQVARMRDEPALGALGTRVEAFPEEALQEGMRRYVQWQNGLLTAEQHTAQIFVESPLCHPSVMLRREALVAVGGFRDGPFPEDYDLWLRLDEAGFRLAKLPELLLRWRCSALQATRTDPRYDRDNFLPLKAAHLARRVRAQPLPLDVWGAGPAGKRLARALEPFGVRAERFIDIDPRKIGRRARGAPIVAIAEIADPGARFVVVALAARGARDLARAELARRGYREGPDYLCAS